MRIKQTRLKLTLISLSLFLIEAILSAFIDGFPFTELISSQGIVVGAYLGAKTANNIQDKKSGAIYD
jgi:hypothetical protein